MNNLILINIFRFIALALLQVLILNHINLFGFLNPMVYIIWIFLFPIRKNKSWLLILSFFLGLTIDIFSDSGGIHAAASVFIAFIRLSLLKAILRKSDFDFLLFNLRNISFGKSFIFIANLTIIHHILVFTLEYFSFNAIFDIFYKSILTSIFTIFLSILGITLFTGKK